MEVHQSLPAQYLHNPYLVKSEQTSSGSESRSPPPNEHLAHTVTTAATSAATLCRQPGAISGELSLLFSQSINVITNFKNCDKNFKSNFFLKK